MSDAERARQGAVADLVAAVERASADLAIAEEPAGFIAALAAAAPAPEHGSAPASRG
jgi:hypothetical protein